MKPFGYDLAALDIRRYCRGVYKSKLNLQSIIFSMSLVLTAIGMMSKS